jgi:hypothetical protein
MAVYVWNNGGWSDWNETKPREMPDPAFVTMMQRDLHVPFDTDNAMGDLFDMKQLCDLPLKIGDTVVLFIIPNINWIEGLVVVNDKVADPSWGLRFTISKMDEFLYWLNDDIPGGSQDPPSISMNNGVELFNLGDAFTTDPQLGIDNPPNLDHVTRSAIASPPYLVKKGEYAVLSMTILNKPQGDTTCCGCTGPDPRFYYSIKVTPTCIPNAVIPDDCCGINFCGACGCGK